MAKRIEKIHEFMHHNNIDALLIKSKTMKNGYQL